VELKTDALNQKSRNTILRIGAKEEGTFHKHLVTWTGPHGRHRVFQHSRQRGAGGEDKAGG